MNTNLDDFARSQGFDSYADAVAQSAAAAAPPAANVDMFGTDMGGPINWGTPVKAPPASEDRPINYGTPAKKDPPPEAEIIAKWIANHLAQFGPPVSDPRANLSRLLGREMSQEEFDTRVAPLLRRKTAFGAGEAGGGLEGTDQQAFEAQDPGMAWTRYLANMGGVPPTGTFGRETLEDKGKWLGPLAKAFDFGASEGVGGQGQDYAGFYNRYGSRGPSWADIRGKASGILGSLGRVDENMLATAKAAMSANKTLGIDPYTDLTMDEIRAAQYTDPADQVALTQAGLNSQLNPTLWADMNKHIRRRFDVQQATRPNERWLQYAQQRGLI